MRKLGVVSIVITLATLLLCSSAIGSISTRASYVSADSEQILGGPARERVSERQSYCLDRVDSIQALVRSGDSKSSRALMVLNDYVTADRLLELVGSIPIHTVIKT